MKGRITADEIVVACDIFHILMHAKSGQISEESIFKTVAETCQCFGPAVTSLKTQTEFIDETDSNVYGSRLWFIPGEHGLMYLLKGNS